MTNMMSSSTVQDRAYKVFATQRKVRFTEMEYAIPRENGREALQRVIDLVRRRSLPIMFPIEVRFSAPDDSFLSTAYGRDTCYIAVHQYAGMEFESYFRAVERSWTTTPVGHTGVNVTIRPPPRFVSAIRSGIGSPRFAIASIRTGCFSTTTPGAFSVPDNESTNPRGVRPISTRSQPRTDISGGMA